MTHKFLPPANVNYSLPFRFVHHQDSYGLVYKWCPEQEVVSYEYRNKVEEVKYSLSSAKGYIEGKNWLVIDETPVMPLGETFQFETKQGTCVCTYTKQIFGNPLVSWSNTRTTRYTEKDCRDNIASGEWIVLPSESLVPPSEPTQTAEQAFEDAFTAVQDMVTPIVKSAKEEAPAQTLQSIVQEYIGTSLEGFDSNITTDGCTVYFIKRCRDNFSIEFKYRNPEPTWAEVFAEHESGRKSK